MITRVALLAVVALTAGCREHAFEPEVAAPPERSAMESHAAAEGDRMSDVRVWRAGDVVRVRVTFEDPRGVRSVDLDDLVNLESLTVVFDIDDDSSTGVLGWEGFLVISTLYFGSPTGDFTLHGADAVTVPARFAGPTVTFEVPADLFFDPQMTRWQASYVVEHGVFNQTIEGVSDLSPRGR